MNEHKDGQKEIQIDGQTYKQTDGLKNSRKDSWTNI